MDSPKKVLPFTVVEPSEEDHVKHTSSSHVAKSGTPADASDMKRMGKAQELNVSCPLVDDDDDWQSDDRLVA